MVYATALSRDAILEGVKSGNVFIDVDGSSDRLLEVEARNEHEIAVMGGALSGRLPMRLAVRAKGVAGSSAVLLIDGLPYGSGADIATNNTSLTFSIAANAAQRWIAVTILHGQRPQLIGNPIYITQ